MTSPDNLRSNFESEQPSPLPFQQSVERLFTTAEQFNVADRPFYFKADWNESVPGQLDSLSVMKLQPTGARRQMSLQGAFRQAQLKITEYPHAYKYNPQSSYAWIETSPQFPREAVSFDSQIITDELGYNEFRPEAIIDQLAQRTTSIQEYNILIHEMIQRKLSESPVLAQRLSQLIKQYTIEGIASRDSMPGKKTIQFDELSHLIHTLDTLNPHLAQAAQSYLLRQFLHSIVLRPDQSQRYSDIMPTQDSAALLLEQALEEGIIPDESQFTKRILSQPHMFRYPFAAKRLLRYLENSHSKSRKIFGAERTSYANDYILMALQNRMRSGQGSPTARRMVDIYLSLTPEKRFDERMTTFEHLIDISDRLTRREGVTDHELQMLKDQAASELLTDDDQEEIVEADTEETLAGLFETSYALYSILEKLRSDNPEQAKQEAALDSVHRHNVELILTPVINRKFGSKTINIARHPVFSKKEY